METSRPILAISVGDPAGIGPEVAVKALSLPEIYEVCRPLVVGDLAMIRQAIAFCGLELAARHVEEPEQGTYRCGTLDVLDMKNINSGFRHKEVSADCGRASFEYVRKVIELAMAGQVDGTVTGPINKEAINLAGFHYAGHTEIFAKFTGTRDYAMMLVHKNFRVIHVTTHVSLREACDRVNKERILTVLELGRDTLEKLGVPNAAIAVAGLNPHSGESGLFGREEIEAIVPAVDEARRRGINVEGPIPPDTVFPKMLGGQYGLVVVMYHDQGHIPIKLLGFQYDEATDTWGAVSGVNITCGLPIVRVSVDHGTAFDRAGEGRANPESMIEAIKTAARLSLRRNA